ncbi:MAG TPA: Rrf2 family transcriptional regulator [Clostridia bacterium]|nr:Rrf2 family transcriptional regulator [Clostridia bacterium]
MRITSRFTIAIHTMLVIACFSDERKVTSKFIAGSTNSNPVVIRRLLGQLKEAGLVEVKKGVGGASIIKPLRDITLQNIFDAVEPADEKIFGFHDNPNCDCPVGKNIHTILDGHLLDIEQAMYNKMRQINLQELLEETKPYM